GTLADRRVEPVDVLLVRTTPEDIIAIRSEAGVELHPVAQYQSRGAPSREATSSGDDGAPRLVQAVVAPRSELAGRTIGALDFHRRYGVIVPGRWRRCSRAVSPRARPTVRSTRASTCSSRAPFRSERR